MVELRRENLLEDIFWPDAFLLQGSRFFHGLRNWFPMASNGS
jgi:hypothetical protein